MSEAANVQLIKELYDTLGKEDLETALALLTACDRGRERTRGRHLTVTRAWDCHLPPDVRTSSQSVARPGGASYSKS
jgi:hypothetical protein